MQTAKHEDSRCKPVIQVFKILKPKNILSIDMSQSFAFEHPDVAFFQTLRSYCWKFPGGSTTPEPWGLGHNKKPASRGSKLPEMVPVIM